MATWRKPFYERHEDSIPRTVAGVRRAWRRRRRSMIRQAAQLRAAQVDAANNLRKGIGLRERNIKLGFEAHAIMDQTRAERARILREQAARTLIIQRTLLAVLTGSLMLLGYSAWTVLHG